MRLATVAHRGAERVGVLAGEDQLVLPAGTDLVDLVVAGEAGLAAATEAPGRRDQLVALGEARLLAPVRRFRRDILCAGWNYWNHFEEGLGRRDGQDVPHPEHPTFFTKGPDTVVGPVDQIGYDPRLSTKWDYEAELAVIIGRTGRSIPAERAASYVWGYTLANDISQRDLQRAHGGQWLKGLISELSYGMTLRAGDLLLTGTPAGVGNARDPQRFLRAGDEVVVRCPELGELRNRLVAADLAGPA